MPFGKYTYCATPITTYYKSNDAQLIVGNFCSFGENVTCFLGGNHRTDWITTYPFGHTHKNVFTTFNGKGYPATKGDIIIGNDVWVAQNVTIMSGVTIGDGAVIANNSHVDKDVAPYSIVGGNPAKFIKYRFTPSQIEQLIQIRWWHWNDNKINQYAHLLCNNDVDEFIKACQLSTKFDAKYKF